MGLNPFQLIGVAATVVINSVATGAAIGCEAAKVVCQVAKPVAEISGALLETGAKVATDASKTALKTGVGITTHMMK